MHSNAYCDYPAHQTEKRRVCLDAVSFLPEARRHETYNRYYAAYSEWLAAGLPVLTGTQLRIAGSAAPQVDEGIRLYIGGLFDVADIIGLKTDI